MNKQFSHINEHKYMVKGDRNPRSYTVCVDPPDYQVFKTAISESSLFNTQMEVTIPIGIAKVNPKDNFCKSIGREVSEKRLFPTHFQVYSVRYEGDNRMVAFLKGKDQDNNTVCLDFSLRKDRNKPLLIGVNIYKE